MKEYIEREAVMQKFADYVKRSNNSDFAPTPTWNQAVQIVEDAPTVDAVEVVRCKDCKHCKWVQDDANWRYVICLRGRNIAQCGDWYCADGERKDGADV